MALYPIDLDFIAEEAVRRKDDYEAFKYYVELDERSDDTLDALVENVAAPIVEAVDCTKCGNCCRSLGVYVTENDTERIATTTHISVDELLSTIIDQDAAKDVGEWGVFNSSPCLFLQDDNLCQIYENRPDSCRAYPCFTPHFRWLVEDILGGVGFCPIIYHVIEQLQQELGW